MKRKYEEEIAANLERAGRHPFELPKTWQWGATKISRHRGRIMRHFTQRRPFCCARNWSSASIVV